MPATCPNCASDLVSTFGESGGSTQKFLEELTNCIRQAGRILVKKPFALSLEITIDEAEVKTSAFRASNGKD